MSQPLLELTPDQESELRKKIAARNIKLKAEKAAQLKNTVKDGLPHEFIKFCRLRAAETPKTDKPDILQEDEHGRAFISRDNLQSQHDAEALERHDNDPLKRFDEWDFPGTDKEREFTLEYDFGSVVKDSLTALNNQGWVYAFGGVGLGKTSLAMRVAWEFLKDKPSEKASFVSVNQYFLDQIKRDNAEQAACRRGEVFYSESLSLRRLVILDDFDKPNFANEHNMRVFLNLIEGLKKRHLVFITANISLRQLYDRYEEAWNIKPTIDRLRQMCLVLPEFKGKSKRRFK